MNAVRPAEILRQLEQSGASDADLLARFIASKDAGAFAELVRRHGALVLGVCRRVTGHPQDAEDAFQAAFLVLAQKAGSLRNAALLGNWLYGVAFRVARRAKRSALRRRTREVLVSVMPEPPAPSAPTASEVQPILDEELAALPEYYREAIVLCDLRGASREEAAAALGIPEGTLSSRLATGRKKLAARLTKRGVGLSVAAIPLAVATAQAAVTLPNELVTKTCGLVAEWAASGVVPGSLAQLAEGGFAVRKTLLLGAVMVVAVTGAVFAARPEAPPVDPPKPPVVAEKPAEQPQPKEEPKPKDEKVVAFTTAPKLRHSFDLSIGGWLTVMWNANGTHLAVAGDAAGGAAGAKKNRWLVLCGVARDAKPVSVLLDDGASLVGVSADGTGLATALREHHLISGRHQLKLWTVVKVRSDNTGDWNTRINLARTVELDSTQTESEAFAPDLKTYRAVAWVPDVAGKVGKLDVLEVDAVTGKARKLPLLPAFRGAHALSPDGKRLAVFNSGASQGSVYNIDREEDISTHTFAVEKDADRPSPVPEQTSIVFSADGKRVVVSRGVTWTTVIDADTGRALPALEGLKAAHAYPDAHCFGADGRLLAVRCQTYKSVTRKGPGGKEQNSWSPGAMVLTVWDTQTGKVLKTWNSSGGVQVAFNPARPLLAILEPNGEGETRVGFWDFAAEVEKK